MPPFPRLLCALALPVAALLLCPVPAAAAPQDDPAEARDPVALRVFLDCRSCDFDFIRQDIGFINWVRDRRDGQVHVLVTRQRTGAGFEFQLEFLGQEEFEGQDQTLRFGSSQTDTEDERRRALARMLRLGLARYIAQTPLAARTDLVVQAAPEGSTATVAATPESDPWNFWVLSTGAQANIEGEQRFAGREIEVDISANRTTEAWKIRSRAEVEYSESDFEFDDGGTFKNVQRSTEVDGQVVKSLGPHWGAGIGASLRRSTFFNLSVSHRGAAAIEYNIYPYAESSQRQITFSYFLGATRFNYEEATIFDLTGETLVDQGLVASLDLRRPWGSASFDLEAMHFVSFPGEYNVQLSGFLEYRIVRGLSFNLRGEIERVRAQRFLPRGGATDEDVLLRRRALETDIRAELGFGLSYTFGSIFNNVVNARLRSRSGRFHTIF